MADDILGGGYMAPAKPFNVLNPSGVSAEASLSILGQVGEGNRTRAFQAGQNAKDRKQRASEHADSVRMQDRELGQRDRQLQMQEQGQSFEQGISERQMKVMEEQQKAARDDEMYKRRMEQHMMRVQSIQDQIDFINEHGVEPPATQQAVGDGLGGFDMGGEVNPTQIVPLSEQDLVERTVSLHQQLDEATYRASQAELLHSLYTAGKDELKGDLLTHMVSTMDANVQTLSADLADLPALLTSIKVGPKPYTVSDMGYAGDITALSKEAGLAAGKGLLIDEGPTLVEKLGGLLINPMEGGQQAMGGVTPPKAADTLIADDLVQFLTAKLADRGVTDTETAQKELSRMIEAADALGQGNKGALVSLEASRDALQKMGADLDFVDAALYRATRLMASGKSSVTAQAAELQGQRLAAGDDPDKGVTQGLKAKTGEQDRFLKAMRSYANATRSDGSGRLVKGWGKSGFVKLYEVDPNDPSKLGAAVNVGAMVSDVMMALTQTANPMDAVRKLTDADPDNDPENFAFVQKLDPSLRKELIGTLVKHVQGMDQNLRDQTGLGLGDLGEYNPEPAKRKVLTLGGEKAKLEGQVKSRQLQKDGAKKQKMRELQDRKRSALEEMADEGGV